MRLIPLLVLLLSPVVINAEVIVVPANGNPQSAFNTAVGGDTIILESSAVYVGNFIIPYRPAGEGFITVRSSRAGELPEGVRVSPAQSALFARLQSPNVDPALKTGAVPAHHWRFIGIEFTHTMPETYSLIRLETPGQDSFDEVPHNLIFDRCYIHGQPTLNVQAGVTMNSAHTTISNSYISEIHWFGVQAYGLGSFNGPGPFTLTNNYIAAAGLNIIFGGSTPAIPNLVPSDITITRSHLHKPLEWKEKWTAVNLLELKSARRVVIADNLMENNWPSAQVGWAVIFNTFHDGWWEVVEDVEFVRNIIRNSTNGINLSGMDTRDGDRRVRMKRITVADNLLEGLGFGGVEAKPFQLLNGSEDVTIDHNTVTTSTHSLVLDSFSPFTHVRLKYTNNLVPHGLYGVFANGGPIGIDAMNQRASDWTLAKNALISIPPDLRAKYPDTFFPATAGGAATMIGTDGLPVGVRSGVAPVPSPTPSPSLTPIPSPTVTPSPSPLASPSPGSDTVSPTANITSPSNGAVLSGVATVTAIASDNVGIDTVYLIVDDAVVASDATAPYSFSVDSSKLTNSNHSMYARAWDRAGNSGDSPSVTFSVSNSTSTPTPTPVPSPTVTPTPAPTPEPCAMVVVVPVLSQFSSGTMRVTVTGAKQSPFTITAKSDSGQITVSPASSAPFTSTPSAVAQFFLRSKRNSGAVTVSGPCGSQVVAVGVR